MVPTSIGPQSFSVAFTRNYLQQIISMLSLSHDLSECTFSLLLVGAKGQIERLPLLEFATPRLKGMLCAKVCELSAVGHEKTENGCEKYPTLEEVAAKQLDIGWYLQHVMQCCYVLLSLHVHLDHTLNLTGL